MKRPIGLFSSQIRHIRTQALSARKAFDPTTPIASWVEKDRLLTGPGNALVIILNSSGCHWGLASEGGCSMCGYSNETSEHISATDLIAQAEHAFHSQKHRSFQAIKLFNSGSFLDSNEIPPDAQESIFTRVSALPAVKEIIIESRPEFVTSKALKRLTKLLRSDQVLEVGIGLESSSDAIRLNNINKGFLFEDYQQAVKTALAQNVRVKTYLLFKPPFLTEKEAIADTIQSGIDAIKAGSRSLSINPVNVQSGTLVSTLWQAGLYRSPWFWSLREVIWELWGRITSEKLAEKVDRIVSDPSGAGTQKGIHNCWRCNKTALRLLKEYSLRQEPAILDTLRCDCFALWKVFLEQEQATRDFSIYALESFLP